MLVNVPFTAVKFVKFASVPFTVAAVRVPVKFADAPLNTPPLNNGEFTILVKLPFAPVKLVKLRFTVFKLVKLPFVKLASIPFTVVAVTVPLMLA